MGGPPQTDYLLNGSFTPTQTNMLLAYIDAPEKFIGPILVAGMVDLLLMGMVITQTWAYYMHYSKDALKLRLLVAVVFIVSSAQSCAVFAFFFRMFAADFGKWEVVVSSTGTLYCIVIVCEALAGILSQMFFLHRAATLVCLRVCSDNRRRAKVLLFGIFAPAMLAGLGLGLTCSVLTPLAVKMAGTPGDPIGATKRLVLFNTAWKSVTVAIDLLLTGTIITCLTLNRTGRRSSDSLLASLTRWTIQAQTLPLIASLACLITTALNRRGSFPAIASNLEGKLCALSILHVCNTRSRLRALPFVQSTGNLDDVTLSIWDDTERSGSRTSKGPPPPTGEKTEAVRIGGHVVTAREPLNVVVGAGGAGMSRKDGLSLEGSLKEDSEEHDSLEEESSNS